ncbi:MAG: TM2 domain-containing protein [Thioploca sp.]|nr:TM2 domain-containing protein [Thioploca sp.]
MDNLLTTPKKNYKNSQPSYLIAYLALIFLGWLGIHRFYLGKWKSGFLYLFSFGFLGLGLLLDMVLLYFMVRTARQNTIPVYLSITQVLFSQQQEKMAPWAEKSATNFIVKLVDQIDNLIRILLFLGGPVFVMMFALYMEESLEIGIFMIFTLILVGYIGNINHTLTTLEQALTNSPSLSRVPFLPDIIATTSTFYHYYYHNKPRSIIYYLLYPLLAPLWLLYSPSAKEEFQLYKNIIIVILAALIIDSLFSYSSTYQPYLSIGKAIEYILTVTLVILFILITALIPTITTSFKFRFSGKQKRIKILTTLTLLLIAAVAFNFDNQQWRMSTSSGFRLESKMETSLFRQDLTTSTEMFLNYYYNKWSTNEIPDGFYVHPKLTDLYHRQIQSITANDEFEAFRVIILPKIQTETGRWIGIHYAKLSFAQLSQPLILFLISPTGRFYTSWQAVPITIQQQFTLLNPRSVQNINIDTYTPNLIAQPLLIDEYSQLNSHKN